MHNLFLERIQQLRMTRGLQIVITFTLTIFIQEWFRYPFAPYTGFVVMVIFIGFDVGMVKARGQHRFWGTLLGCLIGFFYWYIGHFNYRSIFVIIIIWVFAYIYFSNYTYLTSTFFTMSLTLLGKGYFDTQGELYATEMIGDIFISTLFAYIIIMLTHEYFFKDKHLSFQIFYHMLENFLKHIQACEISIETNPHIYINWHHTYEQVLNELNHLTNYIKMNESLITPYMPKQDIEQFMQLAQDYYFGLSLKVTLVQRNDLNRNIPQLPYLPLKSILESYKHAV
jgi:uncharacterized membrane protein YccC